MSNRNGNEVNPYSGSDPNGNMYAAKTAGRGTFGTDIPNPTSYLGIPDDMMSVGYNDRASTHVASEPAFSIHFESDYRITGVRGSATSVRTIETYWNFNAQSNTGSTVQTRNFFTSYVPDFENGGANPFENYAYMMTGSNYWGATGGAGLQVYSGSDPTFSTGTGTILGGFDYDGMKWNAGINVGPTQFATYTTGTGGGTTTCTATVANGASFWVGQYMQPYSISTTGNKFYTAVGVPMRITGIVGNVLTLYNATSQAFAATGALGIQIALPGSINTQKLGVGMGVSNVGGLVFEAGGAGIFHGGLAITDGGFYGSNNPPALLDGRLGIYRGSNAFQYINFDHAGATMAIGNLNGAPGGTSYGIGPAQGTDSNFSQANSWIAWGPTGFAVGGTTADANGRLRIAAGSGAAQGHIKFEPQATYTGAANGTFWVEAAAVKIVLGGVTKTFTLT